MKFTKNTNAFRGTFNEIKIIDYLIKFSNCKPINEIVPKNYAEILASMSPVEMECETDRAYNMAKMIHEYCREELNWFKVDNILWTANPKAFEDEVLDYYCSHNHPADIVLSAPNSYLGISLKNYTQLRSINHKSTSFQNFGYEIPTSRNDAFKTFEEVWEKTDDLEVASKLFHIAKHPYIEVIGYDDYHRTKYKMNDSISKIKEIDFTFVPESNKILFELNGGAKKGFLYFKKSHTTKDGIDKYQIMTNIDL